MVRMGRGIVELAGRVDAQLPDDAPLAEQLQRIVDGGLGHAAAAPVQLLDDLVGGQVLRPRQQDVGHFDALRCRQDPVCLELSANIQLGHRTLLVKSGCWRV